jgi:hypothetical protein
MVDEHEVCPGSQPRLPCGMKERGTQVPQYHLQARTTSCLAHFGMPNGQITTGLPSTTWIKSHGFVYLDIHAPVPIEQPC